MPKRVDHDERRRRLAEAVWAIAATRGLAAATLRDVAAEAGVSMGMVQHYFGTRERLIQHAARLLVDLAGQGARELAGLQPGAGTARADIRAVALQSLPLDEQQRLGAMVWHAFVSAATSDPGLAALVREAWDGAQALVAASLRAARDRGEVRDDVDPDRDATALLALVDGLVAHLVLGHGTPERAVAAVDTHLERLFGNPR